MPREDVEPTVNERGAEIHPAFGLIGAHRVSVGPSGAVLFDSEIRHRQTVIVTLYAANRARELNSDYIGTESRLPIVRVEMSLAQWAAFVSSFGQGDGVPCTIRGIGEEYAIPGIPFEPRLQESMREVREAADKAMGEIREAWEAFEARPIAANRDRLKYAIKNAPANMAFAARSLTEHAENVTQKTRADIEAMARDTAKRLGIGEEEVRELLPGGPD